jgi:hypothetical protein
LLREDFIECLPFDHAVSSIRHQILDEKVGDSFADVDVRPEQGRTLVRTVA